MAQMIAAVSRMTASASAGEQDLTARMARLAEAKATGLVRYASDRASGGTPRRLPVLPALRPLFPSAGLRRGSVVSVLGGPVPAGPERARSQPAGPEPAGRGATTLVLAVLAEASAAGAWCAVVGLPWLGLVAADELGVAVERLALVPNPGSGWPDVLAALIDGVDVVVVAPPSAVPTTLASRLTARARQRGVALLSVGRWPGAELTLEPVSGRWHGLGQGRGRLRHREIDVVAYGRGAAAAARRVRLWLPGPTGGDHLRPGHDHVGPMPVEPSGRREQDRAA